MDWNLITFENKLLASMQIIKQKIKNKVKGSKNKKEDKNIWKKPFELNWKDI